jgi:hypothetical protein
MRKGFLIYEEMRKYFHIYMRRPLVINMTLQLLHSEFPLYEENVNYEFPADPGIDEFTGEDLISSVQDMDSLCPARSYYQSRNPYSIK